MTKVAEEGGSLQPTQASYQKELNVSLDRFENALNSYPNADPAQKAHFQEIMNKQMGLINANVQEIKTSGIQKQSQIVSSNYRKFVQDPSEQNFTTLQQTVSTLKEYANTQQL